MKNVKKVLAIMLVIMLAVVAVPIKTQAAVMINVTNKTMNVGEKTTLKVYGATSKVKWSSSNKKVATVSKSGKVTAKQSGTATISAKVNKKTLKCKITVKVKFSATEATKNISCTLKDTGSGVVAILKNNNKITVSMTAKLAYYSNGAILDTASETNFAFESGKECALFFHAPYDSDYSKVGYDDYKITMSVKEGSSSLICGSGKITVTSNVGADNVSAEVENASGKDLEYINISAVFYDSSGKAIGFDERFVNCKTSGSIDYTSFDFPYDKEYNTITPDSYEIYVNYAYGYNW